MVTLSTGADVSPPKRSGGWSSACGKIAVLLDHYAPPVNQLVKDAPAQ